MKKLIIDFLQKTIFAFSIGLLFSFCGACCWLNHESDSIYNRGYIAACNKYNKCNPEEEAAYYKRAKKIVFTELKEKLGETSDNIPLISICPIHDCCIMQPKNNEMIHHQF